MRVNALVLASGLLLSWSLNALADPPPQAPAHGWRKKHDPEYVGYTGKRWERDYEISSGRCDRNAIGAAIGGIAGAAIGSRIGDGDGRTVAILVGAAVGALIGARIGRALDDGDRACIGHALEIGTSGHDINWVNAATGTHYTLIPGGGSKSAGGSCRNFTLLASADGKKSSQAGVACRAQEGVWKIRQS